MKQSNESFNLYLETLFELYESKGYSQTRIALELALQRINDKLENELTIQTRAKQLEYKKLIESEIATAYDGTFEAIQEDVSNVMNVVAGAYGMNKLPTKVIDDIINGNNKIQGYTFEKLFSKASKNEIARMKAFIGSDVAKGMNSKVIGSELSKINDSSTKGQLQTIVRTVISEARERARTEAYKEFEKDIPNLQYKYTATLDGRTTDYCINHDGRIYDTLKAIDDDLNSHWNCRSVKSFVVNGKVPPKRASYFSQVDNKNYKEWFSELTEEQKKVMLGKKYNAYKKGTWKIEGLADVKATGTKLSLDDVESAIKLPKIPKIDFGYDGRFNKYVEDIRDEAKIVIDKLPKPSELIATKNVYESNYNLETKKLTSSDDKLVFLHEYGHHLDSTLKGNNKVFASQSFLLKPSFIDEDSDLFNTYEKRELLRDKWFDSKNTYFTKGVLKGELKAIEYTPKESHYGLWTDIIDSLYEGSYFEAHGIQGHGERYYSTTYNKVGENFANMFALWSDKKNWQETKKMFPNLTKAFEDEMEKIINE